MPRRLTGHFFIRIAFIQLVAGGFYFKNDNVQTNRYVNLPMRLLPHSITAFIWFLVITAAYAVMATWYPVAFVWATYEDLYGEWAQTFFFAIALVFCILLAVDRSQQRWFFALLSVALFYVVMEEISWGQRIIGFETPDLLMQHNIQREANIHNLFTGPIDTWIKRSLEYVLASAFVGYGLIYPLLIRTPSVWLQQLEARWLPAPPLYLWPYFVTAAYLELGYLDFNEAEIAEVLIGAAMALLCGHYWFVSRLSIDIHRPCNWPAGISVRLALLISSLFAVNGLLSVVTTQMLYRDPEIKVKTDNRLLNGYEKFAGRYADYGQWQVSAELYLIVHKAEPSRTSVMRRLADAYRKNDNIIGFNQYNQMSLDTLLTTQAENPNKASTNLALYYTYRQRGLSSKAMSHLQQAHALTKQRYEQKPENANNAYWLAKTYKELGDWRSATRYYREAFEREPSVPKYRKAYHAMSRYQGRVAEQSRDTDNE